MAETPRGVESLVPDFTTVQNAKELLRELKKIPDGEQPFMAAAEPYSTDVSYRDREFLAGLLENMFQYADASSTRKGTPAERTSFLEKLISETLYDDGAASAAFIAAVRRAIIAEFPEYAGTPSVESATPGAPAAATVPEATAFILGTVTPEMQQSLVDLGYPAKVVSRMTLERAQEVLAAGKTYLIPKAVPAKPPVVPAPAPAPKAQLPADLSRLMSTKAETVVSPAPASASAPGTPSAQPPVPPVAPEAALLNTLDQDPAFRSFFARVPNGDELLAAQNVAAIETYRQAFAIKNQLATDLYELANGAITGDFLLDFENPASNLPKNAKAEFQRYVDAEALERPEQLLKLAEDFQARQVLEKNIATAKAEVERLGGKNLFDQAEREALEIQGHLERVHESTRRNTITGFIPHGVHLAFLKVAHTVNEWAGWKGQTEVSIRDEFAKKREALLSGRVEADLSATEKVAFNELSQKEMAKIEGLKKHQLLGDRMVEVSQQGASRAKLSADGVKLGLGSMTTYSPAWIHHPQIAQKLKEVNERLAGIRQRKQTIEQMEQNLAATTQIFEVARASLYKKDLPPTIALVKYAQAQIKNTLTSFTSDTAVEDLQRIYDYALLLSSRGEVGAVTGAKPFEDIVDFAQTADKLHEAIVSQWGKRVFDIFEKTSLNKKGAIAEMEKTIKDILKQKAIGGYDAESKKAEIVKNLLTEAFKKIDPAKGDGKERRMALIGVMISCGLLKKGEKITT